MLRKSCLEFLNELASKAAVPGGGGASAYVGAVGIALGTMVGSLTAGKKKYAHVEAEIQDLMKRSEALRHRLEDLVNKDAEGFAPLAEAYGLPGGTEAEAAEKERVIQGALVGAAAVPMEIAECSLEAIRILCDYAEKGSVMVESDAGTGLYFCKAALLGARMNVMVNLRLMKDQALRERLRTHLEEVAAEGVRLADRACALVEEHMEVKE